eukprot:3482179-Amphidinium_carterae.2
MNQYQRWQAPTLCIVTDYMPNGACTKHFKKAHWLEWTAAERACPVPAMQCVNSCHETVVKPQTVGFDLDTHTHTHTQYRESNARAGCHTVTRTVPKKPKGYIEPGCQFGCAAEQARCTLSCTSERKSSVSPSSKGHCAHASK